MFRANGLHFLLHGGLRGIYVIKLLLATLAAITLFLCVEHLVQMKQIPHARAEQPQLIEAAIATIHQTDFGGIRLQHLRAYQNQRTKVKIIAQTAFLIVNERMGRRLALNHRPMVGINQGSARCLRRHHHAFQRTGTEKHR